MNGNDELLSRVENCRAGGRLEEAAALAKGRRTKERRDAALHLKWADVLEELGLTDDVVFELNLAIRDDQENEGAYLRLAEIYLDQGQPQRSARVWQRLVELSPTSGDYFRQWGQALEEAGDYEGARRVYETGRERTNDPCFDGLLRNLSFLESTGVSGEAGTAGAITAASATATGTPADAGTSGRGETPGEAEGVVGGAGIEVGGPQLPQPHQVVTFLSLFGGREGVYARQWVSPTGESGYSPVEEPLTPKVAENHLLGNFTVGVYPVRMDNTVNFIAFDFDLAKFAVKKAITSRRLWEAAMDKVHRTACRLLDIAAAAETTAYMEDSGFKGRHVWLFLDAPVPAGVAKKCGDLMAGMLTPLPPEVTVEVFPRQGSVARGGLGNLIKLPLGIHKRTGKAARFIHPDGRTIPDQLHFLTTIKRTSKRAIYAFIQRRFNQGAAVREGQGTGYGREGAGAVGGGARAAAGMPPCREAEMMGREAPRGGGYGGYNGYEDLPPWEGAVAVPAAGMDAIEAAGTGAMAGATGRSRGTMGNRRGLLFNEDDLPELAEAYDLERDPQFQALIARCPVLHAIVEGIHRTAQLSKEETLVLIHTVGHLERGPEAVNALFQRVLQADPALFMKSRLRGNPMSCPKIRARIPGITAKVSCNCAFELGTNLYPTPVIHVRGVSAETFGSPLGLSADSLQFQNLLQEYVKLRKEQREIAALMGRYELKLDRFFDETGVESVRTPLGELRRRKEEGAPPSFTLEI